jgi:hypothetical protein
MAYEKGQCHEIFDLCFFMYQFPLSPKPQTIRAALNLLHLHSGLFNMSRNNSQYLFHVLIEVSACVLVF